MSKVVVRGYYFLTLTCMLCRVDTDQTMEEPLLEVIFSKPMLGDLKKLESSQVQPLNNKEEKLPDSDQDDRGELLSLLECSSD